MSARDLAAFEIAARAMTPVQHAARTDDSGPRWLSSIDRIGASLAAILAIAPLLPRGPLYLGWPPAAYVELVIPSLFLVWLAARLTTRGRAAIPSPVPLWPWDLFAAAIAGATLLGLMADNIIVSPVFGTQLRAAVGGELFRPLHQTAYPLYSLRAGLTLLEGWIVVRLLVDTCSRGPNPASRARLALAGWGVGFGLAAAFAIVQYVTRFQLLPYWVKANPSLVRANSTLDDPNALGACLVLGIGLLVGMLRLGDRSRRTVWWALLPLGLAGLAATMSRSALGAMAVAPSMVLAFIPPAHTRLDRAVRTCARIAFGGLTVAVLGSMMLRAASPESRRSQPSNMVEMVVKTFDPRESTGWVLRGRLPWWRAGAAMFAAQPLTGVGSGRYMRMMRSYGGGKVENTHNFFLQMFAEAGVLGGTAFIVLCVSLCAAFRRALKDGRDRPSGLALGGLIGVVAFLLTLLTGHTLLVAVGQIAFASFSALTTIAASRDAPVRAPAAGRRIVVAAAVLLVAAVAPLSGIVRGVAPPLGDWGYSEGLYQEERSANGDRWRWTTSRAQLELAVPAGATSITLEGAAARPATTSPPTHVRITAGAITLERLIGTPAPQRFQMPVPPGAAPVRMLVTIEVEPTWVPASSGKSPDTRQLGLRLRVPTFDLR